MSSKLFERGQGEMRQGGCAAQNARLALAAGGRREGLGWAGGHLAEKLMAFPGAKPPNPAVLGIVLACRVFIVIAVR